MKPEKLSHQLRQGHSTDLTRRRWVVGLSLLGVAAGAVVSLYQTGIVRRLPSLPFDLFDATKVDASGYAYKRFHAPDAPLMVVNYGVTAWLASMGGKNRAQELPWAAVALGAKTVLDAALTLKLAREEWQENHALCDYCQAATVASLASVALATPEALTAVQHIKARL